MDIRDEGNHLALTFAANAILALLRAGLLSPGERAICAERAKRFADLADRTGGEDRLPPQLALQMHDVARLLLKDGERPG